MLPWFWADPMGLMSSVVQCFRQWGNDQACNTTPLFSIKSPSINRKELPEQWKGSFTNHLKPGRMNIQLLKNEAPSAELQRQGHETNATVGRALQHAGLFADGTEVLDKSHSTQLSQGVGELLTSTTAVVCHKSSVQTHEGCCWSAPRTAIATSDGP